MLARNSDLALLACASSRVEAPELGRRVALLGVEPLQLLAHVVHALRQRAEFVAVAAPSMRAAEIARRDLPEEALRLAHRQDERPRDHEAAQPGEHHGGDARSRLVRISESRFAAATLSRSRAMRLLLGLDQPAHARRDLGVEPLLRGEQCARDAARACRRGSRWPCRPPPPWPRPARRGSARPGRAARAAPAASSLASISLKRLFSRRILAIAASSCDSSASAEKCICRASACSICCDQATRSCASSSCRLCAVVVDDGVHAHGRHRDEQQRDDQERAEQLGVQRGADAGDPAHQAAQRGALQHDCGDLLER